VLGHGRAAADFAGADILASVTALGPALDHVAIWCPPCDSLPWRVDLEFEEPCRLGVTVMLESPAKARDTLVMVADYLRLAPPAKAGCSRHCGRARYMKFTRVSRLCNQRLRFVT
jgi:hypothetical protein